MWHRLRIRSSAGRRIWVFWNYARNARWHLRLAICALAREVLSAETSRSRELNFAARCVNSVEINGSFYSLQSPNAYRQWYDNTPPDFLFSVKGSSCFQNQQ